MPYDFDQAGLISTKYAMPAPGLRIRSVRQRIYRGRCRHNDQIESTVSLFNEKRPEIERYLVPEELSDSMRSRLRKYVGDFYEIINDDSKQDKKVAGKCIGT